MKKKKTIALEVVDLSEAMANVKEDHENGILKDVVLLTGGKPTKNKTLYSDTALAEAAIRYRNAKMFLDHGDEYSRSVRDFGGVYKNVHLEGQKVIGDLHLAESAKSTAFSMAKLSAGGLSISDRGQGHDDGDVFVIDKFVGKGPFSIDLVAEPSANMNLFESHENDDDEENNNKGGNEMDITKLTLEELKKGNPALHESIVNDSVKTALAKVEEKIKKGEDSEKVFALGKKLSALAEAGFPPEVSKSVRKTIERDDVTLEGAMSLIEAQTEIIKQISVTPAGKPKVKGAGADRGVAEGEEGAEGEVTSEKIREALIA